ncbi:MAG: hypothetical protein AB8B71_02390 [Paracoccaceae bacterium]
MILNVNMSIPERIAELVQHEIADYPSDTIIEQATLRAFRAVLRKPREARVQFSAGILQKCWAITRPNGDHRVVYMPRKGYFSLCVESDFGLLDIGVHGSAIGCFSSV